ncbi:MAG: tetratricopeptide repeat protein [Bacteroidota bacterium]
MTRNLLLSALILFPLWINAQDRNPTIRSFRAEKLYLEGLQQFKNRQFYDAIDTFDKVVELNDKHPNVYEARGDAYYQLEKFEQALSDYEEAIDLDPDNANLWNNAGVAAGDMNMFRAAANYFFEAVQIDPNNKDANDNYLEARRLLNAEGIAYEEPRRPRSWRDEDDIYNNGNYGSGYGDSGRDRDDRERDRPWESRDRDDDRNSSSSSSTRPSKYNPTRPGDNKNQDLDKFNNETRNSKREYKYNSSMISIGPRTDIQLKLDQVWITKNSTMLSFTLKNLSDKSFPVKLAKQKKSGAWYITDRSFGRIYTLKAIKSLDGWAQGNSYNLKARGTKVFIAEFERLDDDVWFFHLLEGKTQKPGAWNMYDIELSRN